MVLKGFSYNFSYFGRDAERPRTVADGSFRLGISGFLTHTDAPHKKKSLIFIV